MDGCSSAALEWRQTIAAGLSSLLDFRTITIQRLLPNSRSDATRCSPNTFVSCAETHKRSNSNREDEIVEECDEVTALFGSCQTQNEELSPSVSSGTKKKHDTTLVLPIIHKVVLCGVHVHNLV